MSEWLDTIHFHPRQCYAVSLWKMQVSILLVTILFFFFFFLFLLLLPRMGYSLRIPSSINSFIIQYVLWWIHLAAVNTTEHKTSYILTVIQDSTNYEKKEEEKKQHSCTLANAAGHHSATLPALIFSQFLFLILRHQWESDKPCYCVSHRKAHEYCLFLFP